MSTASKLLGSEPAAKSELLSVGIIFWVAIAAAVAEPMLPLSLRVGAPGAADAGAAGDFLTRGITRFRPSTRPNMTCERTARINSGSSNSSGRVAVTNLKLLLVSSSLGDLDEVRLLVRRRDGGAAGACGAEGAVHMAKGSYEGLVMWPPFSAVGLLTWGAPGEAVLRHGGGRELKGHGGVLLG